MTESESTPVEVPVVLALLCVLVGGALFVWVARLQPPQSSVWLRLIYLAEITAPAIVMCCGAAALFARFARSQDLEERACEMFGYAITVIGIIGSLVEPRPPWAISLTIIGYPIGRLCRRLAYPPSPDQQPGTIQDQALN